MTWVALTVHFNWHLIESKCDVNWHEFVEIWCNTHFMQFDSSSMRLQAVSRFIGKTVMISVITFSIEIIFHHRMRLPTIHSRLYSTYHKIGNDSTEHKTKWREKHKQNNKKPTRYLMLETTLIKINSFILGLSICCWNFIHTHELYVEICDCRLWSDWNQQHEHIYIIERAEQDTKKQRAPKKKRNKTKTTWSWAVKEKKNNNI